jgi:hypothetical protein
MIGARKRQRVLYATRSQRSKSEHTFLLDGMPLNVLQTISQQLLTETSRDEGIDDVLAMAGCLTDPGDRAIVLDVPKHARVVDEGGVRKVLPLLTGLASLDIDPVCRAGLGMLRATLTSTSRLPTLRKLVVRHAMHLGSAPRQLAASMAARMPALTDLELHFHQRMMPSSLSTSSSAAAAAAAESPGPNTGDQEMAALMSAFPGLKRLVVTGATVRRAEPLASALSAMHGLEDLRVPGALLYTTNDVCEELVRALGRSRHRGTLRRLDLSR